MKIIRYAIVTTMVAIVLASFAATQAYPRLTGHTAVRIIGASMGDALPFGSIAYVRPSDEYRVGDIVSYHDGQFIVTHRLADDADGLGTLWQTKGDANEHVDPILIRNEIIVGRVESYLPLAGHAAALLERWYVTAFLMLIAIAMLWWPETPLRQPEPDRTLSP